MQSVKKIKTLEKILQDMGSVLIAYSGGVDSSFLLKVASDCLKDKVLAVTAVSETYTKEELEFARRFCRRFNIRHKVIRTQELGNRRFVSNTRQRCYFCKRELFSKLKEIAQRNKIKYIIDGTNSDDKNDFRPGEKAKYEFGVSSPLDEAGISKKDIRYLSMKLKLPGWDRPQMACLASRMQYGTVITKARLRRVEAAENILRDKLTPKDNIRVRDYVDSARIEVDKRNIPFLVKSDGFISKLKRLGFKRVSVDLEGYRTGSMNQVRTQLTE
ncbi:MAG: ATP-dependent sacrificial sulfur transferase LarE [Candidatus Omnitrophica bacterium]|nr:ATP-dependent sacrificial sulfur transferase LarE [Candidatus Omnitrophota bacterium]MDD5355507.1 ATP-dependent sacrificial sulfur transferase LarE [Candidatus Omnitrophota bacterium]